MKVLAVLCLVLVGCNCRSTPEESVVSVYTTLPATAGTRSGDVYAQIANNIAERITSPIYRFLGIERNKTDEKAIPKAPWEKIELLGETPEEVIKVIEPVDNDIAENRDIEELSIEGLKKNDKKPEKFTLFSNYLPVQTKESDELSLDDIDDPADDAESLDSKPREGPFVYILELLGSLVQLAWGALESVFRPSKDQSNDSSQTVE